MSALARNTDPVTSHLAGERAQQRAATGRALALALLRDHSEGLTDFELAGLSGWQQTSIGKRRGELRDAGLVRDSGKRRPSPSGSPAIVWEALQETTMTDASSSLGALSPDAPAKETEPHRSPFPAEPGGPGDTPGSVPHQLSIEEALA